MDRKFLPLPPDLVQTHPGLGLLRLAALIAEGSEADEDTLDVMFEQMETGALDAVPPAQMWPELARGLMAPSPGSMIRALRECGVLGIILPEVSALFGVPQIADDPSGQVDLGPHLINALNAAARRAAPLEVRFALLVMNVGKSDSPREHLPSHYRHVERGGPRIEDICERFAVPESCRELALLALADCERVHRASEVRAGPVAALLERIGAFRDPELFARLLLVAEADYFAYGDRRDAPYPKAVLLKKAAVACAGLMADDEDDIGALRAAAIARALRSERWSNDAA